eukprot:16615-Heterococcus_DN1.PRE.2
MEVVSLHYELKCTKLCSTILALIAIVLSCVSAAACLGCARCRKQWCQQLSSNNAAAKTTSTRHLTAYVRAVQKTHKQ